MSSRLKLWILLLIAGVLPAPAFAVAQFTINTSDDVMGNDKVCSLRAAFANINTMSKDGIGGAAANNPDCPQGEIFNEIRFSVPKVLLKEQINHHAGVVTMYNNTIDGNLQTRLLHLSGAAALILERMTLANGNGNSGSGGAILVEGEASLFLRASTFRLNHAATDGGAIAFMSSGEFHTFRARFTNNEAEQRGGAILFGGSTPAGQPPMDVWASKFELNIARESGGAIECTSPEIRLAIILTNFVENLVVSSDGTGTGGAVSSYCQTVVRVTRLFGNSVSQGKGGALYTAGPATVTDTFFQSNSAGSLLAGLPGQAGGYFIDGPAVVKRNSYYDNEATDRAGALMVGDGAANHEVQIGSSSFIGNQSLAGDFRPGAAIWVTGLSFPRLPKPPLLDYEPYRFAFLNNTVAQNLGSDQIHLETGTPNELLFVNNLLQHSIVAGCGGDPARLQLQLPLPTAKPTNVQWPGKSCDTPMQQVPSFEATLGPDRFGGTLAQHYRLPVFNDPYLDGDELVCTEVLVSNLDQLGNKRVCHVGSVEQDAPPVFPLEFYP